MISTPSPLSKTVRVLKWIGVGLLALLAGATVFGSIYEAVARNRAHDLYPPPGRRVDIGGRKLHLDCRGVGSPTVILESGLDTNGSLAWDKVQDPVSTLTRTCSYDRAGVMWSDPKAGAQDADGVVQDLHAALTALGINGPLVLVCHSLGGPYIMNYTKKYGDEVKGLVFVDCSHPDQLTKLGVDKIPKGVPLVYKVLDALSWTGILRLTPEENPPGMPERTKPIGRAYLGESFDGSMKEMANIEATFREGGALRTLGDRPLVVLTAMQPFTKEARESIGLSVEEATTLQTNWQKLNEDAASWSTHSRRQSVPDSMHYIQYQRPDLVIQAITEVVNEVRAANALSNASIAPTR